MVGPTEDDVRTEGPAVILESPREHRRTSADAEVHGYRQRDGERGPGCRRTVVAAATISGCRILGDKKHPQHEMCRDWMQQIGETDYDPARFDLDEINEALAQLGTGALPQR